MILQKHTHDIILIGAGPVGLTMAIALAQSGFKIALVEKAPLSIINNPQHDGRGYALSYGTIMIFKALGLWHFIENIASPIRSIHVQENKTPCYLNFEANQINADAAMGYLVESHILRDMLWHGYVEEKDNITLITESEIIDYKQDPHQAIIHLNDQILSAPLLIAADGRHSSFKQRLNIQSKTFPYNHHALVTRFKHVKPHNHRAYEYFYPAGPFAILPLMGNESSLVWCDKPEIVTTLKTLNNDDFAAHIYERFSDLGHISCNADRFSYPLSAILSEKLYQGRVVLLGDAAQAIHPVAGQGLNLGMRGLAELAEHIVNARLHGQDWGDSFVLDAYQKKILSTRRKFFILMHGLVKLYDIDFKPLSIIRNIGLGLVNRLPPLKHAMMREAMGAGSTQPKLMRGETLIAK
ncbi:MAG: UbiH/UbiF/VisC/COQ6 family ubiquinone biosynthesis hydroxylase [Alphaproteobacteria bacterium]|nr:UbiH/UbiF/VisC/COQ6 family ubiquinone biosynthesis hydroxylase [Alphaproteobacteria bacterium]